MQGLIDEVVGINSIDAAVVFLKQKLNALYPSVEDALNCCVESHKGQKRKSGDDYAVHPILVAAIVSHFGGSEPMIKAALLHDVVEDTGVEKSEIAARFGEDVALLVDGLTKIDEISDISTQNLKSVEEIAFAADHLYSMADGLKNKLEVFGT